MNFRRRSLKSKFLKSKLNFAERSAFGERSSNYSERCTSSLDSSKKFALYGSVRARYMNYIGEKVS